MKKIKEICKSLSAGKENTDCLFMMVALPETILSIFFNGQDEIVYITFFMYAIWHYLKGNIKKYYFWAVWSVICCPLMLLPYMIIVIADDKKIYAVIGKLLLPFIPQCVYKMFFSQCLSYRYTGMSDYIKRYFSGSAFGTENKICSVFAIVLLTVFLFAYLYETDNVEEKMKSVFYMITVLFIALTILGETQTYRNFLWIPFAVLFVVCQEDERNRNICFGIMMATGIAQSIRTMYITNPLCTEAGGRLSAAGYRIFGELKYVHFPLLSEQTGIEITFLNSFMVACLIAFAYLGRRKESNRFSLHIEPEFWLLGSSLVLPVMLVYSFLCAYVIG